MAAVVKLIRLTVFILWLLQSVQAVAQQLTELVYSNTLYTIGVKHHLPDGEQAFRCQGNTDLLYKNLTTGEVRVLYDAGPQEAAVDAVSLDGRYWYPTIIWESEVYPYSGRARGSDIVRIDLQTGEVVQITHGESTPIPGVTEPLPVFNGHACPLPDGRIFFISSRNQLAGPAESRPIYTQQQQSAREPVCQLFVMNGDGSGVEQIGHLNLSGVLHPFLGKDGYIYYWTRENQGNRSDKLWGLWKMKPDGSDWQPVLSAFEEHEDISINHGGCQLSNWAILFSRYYPNKMNNYGHLTMVVQPAAFGSDAAANNIKIKIGDSPTAKLILPFFPTNPDPFGTQSQAFTPWARSNDRDGFVVAHPAPARDAGVILSLGEFSFLGGNKGNNQIIASGIYYHPEGPIASKDDLVMLVDEPGALEFGARVVASMETIYGSTIPIHERVSNPTGTPYCIFGSSSTFLPNRQSKQVNGINRDGRWRQGTDAGDFNEDEIEGIIFFAQYPTPRVLSQLRDGIWTVDHLERTGVLGTVPLAEDGSWKARVLSQCSLAWGLYDSAGRVLVHPGTWKMGQAGEIRVNCNGCHAHSTPNVGPAWETSLASAADYPTTDLSKAVPRLYEFTKDVKPILESHGLDADPSIRESVNVKYWHSRQSLLMNAAAFTEEEFRTLALWIDTGAAVDGAAGLYWLDTNRPALYLADRTDEQGMVKIGSDDLEGEVTVSATVDGQAAQLTEIGDHVWGFALNHDALVVATSTDENGLVRTLERQVKVGPVVPPPPPPTPDEVEQLKQQIAALQQQLTDTQAALTTATNSISALMDKIMRAVGVLQE